MEKRVSKLREGLVQMRFRVSRNELSRRDLQIRCAFIVHLLRRCLNGISFENKRKKSLNSLNNLRS